ncbi:MAG: MlaD family protein [Pirellulaceae bacterium]
MISDGDIQDMGSESPDEFPVAEVRPRVSIWKKIFGGTRMWIATLFCLIVAAVLIGLALSGGGRTITIAFEDGFGIKPGDTLRYRGIDVGEVRQVAVNSSLEGVTVHVGLNSEASELARKGSRFWIERPQFGLSRITGLETVVGAKYIGVIPGPADGPTVYHFQGVESPPVIRDGTATGITIHFSDGFGISTGDLVKHLGIVIGEVTAVGLDPALDGVTVHVRLADFAESVARAGSQFWIERPEIGLSEIRGLETLIAGPYIDVVPGPADGQVVTAFQGLVHAPPAPRLAEGLEVVLYSQRQGALKPGVPVNYRGVNVGHVVSVSLASDAATVEARVYIQPDYKALVRVNSRFWSNIGIDADFGVGGFSLKTDSLQALAVGSIGFATPDVPGRRARTGDRFECAPVVEDEWREWSPQIVVGDQLLPEGSNRPEAIRSTLRWQQKRLGFTRNIQLQGWLILLDNNRLLGLSRYLEPPAEAIEGTAVFEMSGVEFAFDASQLQAADRLATCQLSDQLPEQTPWPVSKLRSPGEAEDCLIISDPQSTVLPLSSTKIVETRADSWLVSPSMSFNAALDGASVVSRTDGAILGFLDLEKGQAEVVLVQPPQ